MSSRASSWTLMADFLVQECCVHGTDLENHGPTSILCDDPLPIESTQQPPLFRALVRSRRPACTCSTSSPGPRQCSCSPRTRGEQRVNIFTEQHIFSPPRPGRTTWRGCGGCRPPRCRCPGWRGAGGRHTPSTPSPSAARSPPARWALGHQDPIFLQSLMWWRTKIISWSVITIGEIPQEYIFFRFFRIDTKSIIIITWKWSS